MARLILSTPKAAEYMDLSPRTLEAWRGIGKGPRFRKVGRLVRYDTVDLDAFLDASYVETPDSLGLRGQPLTRAELIDVAGPEIAANIMERWGGQKTWIPASEKTALVERRRKAIKMRREGVHVSHIAERLGCSTSTIYSDLDGMPAMDDPTIKRWHGHGISDMEGGSFWNGSRMS